MPSHILVVDDDPAFLRVCCKSLKKDGLQVSTATSTQKALALLEAQGAIFSVVLIAWKMPRGGPADTALELVAELGHLAPFAKPIIVTGHAPPATFVRAFRAGVYDYLTKNIEFDTLLRMKVRNAVEVTRSQRKLAMTTEEVAHELGALWLQVRRESARNRKGALLDQLLYLLFQATPGFGRVVTRLDDRVEEISIVIENRDNEAPWKGECTHLVGECKKWSSPCGRRQVQYFLNKLIANHPGVCTGFLIAPGGFSPDAYEDARGDQEGKRLVILIDNADLERWVTANDRFAVLRSFHERAMLRQKHDLGHDDEG